MIASEEKSDTVSTPEAGIHRSLDFETYAAWPLLNSTTIRAGSSRDHGSMRRMKWTFDGRMPSDDTRDRKLGRGLHCLLLEPDQFEWRFEIQKQCAATKKGDGKRCDNLGVLKLGNDWFCRTKGHAADGAVEPDDYLSTEEHSRITTAISELKDHPAVKMLRQHGGCEESAVAEISGERVKCRFDKRLPGEHCPPTIIDVKKTSKGITQWRCENAIKTYQYAIQMALYCRVAEKIAPHPEGEPYRGCWIFVEDKPPYDINCILMNEEQRRESYSIIDAIVRRWKSCCESEEWPGVAPHLNEFGSYHETL